MTRNTDEPDTAAYDAVEYDADDSPDADDYDADYPKPIQLSL